MNQRKGFSREVPDELAVIPSDPDDSEVEGDLESEGKSNDYLSTDESVPDNKEASLSEPEIDNEGGWTQAVDNLVLFDNIEKNPKVLVDLGDDRSEINYFLSIFHEELLNKIVVETNIYANQKTPQSINEKSSKPDTRWTDVTLEELKVWFGIHILMAIHQLPALEFTGVRIRL